MMDDKSPQQKDHELAVHMVAKYLGKAEMGKTVEIVALNVDRSQSPQVVAEIDGELMFILVRVARYPEEATIADSFVDAVKLHAEAHGAAVAFAPVGLWPTGDRDEAGNEAFYVKFEGIERR